MYVCSMHNTLSLNKSVSFVCLFFVSFHCKVFQKRFDIYGMILKDPVNDFRIPAEIMKFSTEIPNHNMLITLCYVVE